MDNFHYFSLNNHHTDLQTLLNCTSISPATAPNNMKCIILKLRSLSDKIFIVNDFVSPSCLDFVFIRNMGCCRFFLTEVGPPGYTFLNKPDFQVWVGSLALFTKESTSSFPVMGESNAFELLSIILLRHSLVSCGLIYRSPKPHLKHYFRIL